MMTAGQMTELLVTVFLSALAPIALLTALMRWVRTFF